MLGFLFQFHKVQLKGCITFCRSIPRKFQFHKVQLKELDFLQVQS